MTNSCSYHWGDNSDLLGPLGIDYYYFYECSPDASHFLIIIFLFLWVIMLMNLLAQTASDYFSPTLSKICENLHLAYDIAGVTFLALGNGAPDFFSLIASFSGGVDVLVGVGALLGGSMFVCTVVVGSIGILCPCEVSKRLFLRDIGFHLVSITTVAIVGLMQQVTIGYAIGLLCLYASYVTIVLIGSYWTSSQVSTDPILGDIGMENLLSSPTIQTAFWHPTASSVKKAMAVKPSSSSSSSSAASGYSFLILKDEDEKEGGIGDDDDDEESSTTINLNPGFEPEFDDIIKEDFYSPEGTSIPSYQGQRMEQGQAGSGQGKAQKAILSHANGKKHIHHSGNNGNSTSPMHSASAPSSPSSPNPLIQDSTTTTSSSEHMTEDERMSSFQSKLKKYRHLLNRNAIKYQDVMSALYWQQWAITMQFRHRMNHSPATWSTFSWYYKTYLYLEYPFVLARDLTIPNLELSEWNKFYAIVHPIADPMFILILLGQWEKGVGYLPSFLFCLLIGIIPSGYIYLYSTTTRAPDNSIFLLLWSLIAFVMNVFWIYMLAGELINCLSTLGIILELPPAFLGLTVLAWGNSVGDFFTNTSVAKQGLGSMALAGCYGGPVFNILVGFGSALLYASSQAYPAPYPVVLDSSSIVSLIFLFIALTSTIIMIPLRNYQLDQVFGIYLITLYAVYSITQGMLVMFS